MAISGVKATKATIPKASVIKLPPRASHTPMLSGSKNVEVIGPLATPPESKAIPIKISGTSLDKIKAMIYPGITNQLIEMPVKT